MTNAAVTPATPVPSTRLRTDAIWLHCTPVPSVIGSTRLMATVPAQALGARVVYVPAGVDPDSFIVDYPSEAVIVGKPFEEHLPRVAVAAARAGRRVLTAFVDLHVGNAVYAERYRQQIEVSDHVVVQTEHMAARFREVYATPLTIIEDPCEYPAQDAAFAPQPPTVKVLWVGSPNNHDTLPGAIASLSQVRGASIHLVVLAAFLPEEVRAAAPGGTVGALRIAWLQWSMQAQFELYQWCDAVIVPSIDRPEKAVKSHNRVAEPLNAGRAVIAHPLPQYRELEDFVVLDTDMARGLATAMRDPKATLERIRAGQQYVEARFSPRVTADKWRRLLDGD